MMTDQAYFQNKLSIASSFEYGFGVCTVSITLSCNKREKAQLESIIGRHQLSCQTLFLRLRSSSFRQLHWVHNFDTMRRGMLFGVPSSDFKIKELIEECRLARRVAMNVFQIPGAEFGNVSIHELSRNELKVDIGNT
jgi:hypothetical protein